MKWIYILPWCLTIGCSSDRPSERKEPARTSLSTPTATVGRTAPRGTNGPPKDPVSLFANGVERMVERSWARAQGYTILDLGDEFAPYPFSVTSSTPPKSVPGRGTSPAQPNSYRRRYLDLANDRVDRDGKKLRPGQHNHLELYGIPPSFGVLRRRFLAERDHHACFDAVDREVIRTLDRPIVYKVGRKAARRFLKQAQNWEGALARLLRKHRLANAAEARARNLGRQVLRAHRLTTARLRAIQAVQSRLLCEGVVRRTEPLKPGIIDWHHQKAMVRFERKHMIFGWGGLRGTTQAALARTPLENNHRALLRALRERVATSLGILEDGSVPASWPNAASAGGKDLVGDRAHRLVKALGVETPVQALRFFERRSGDSIAHLAVALRLPPLPDYYGPNMDLRVVIDRGDVYYAFPYDEKGKPVAQPKARRPRLSVFVHHRERRLPLVRWATTIGGWRTEVRHGCHYWKYKNSEVGDRLWKFLVAGPVWIPPPGTPPRSLVAKQWVKGRVKYVPKQWEIGPGYQSAYGLVAALHTREVRRRGQVMDEDGGIRTHGSADYMSILGRHSHGCHRLYNHLAVRLMTFLLRHRRHERMGEQPVKWEFAFRYKDQRIRFSRSHKGYYYRLVPPVPVQVTRGRVLGTARRPIRRFVRKPSATGSTECTEPPTRPGPTPGANPQSANPQKYPMAHPRR
jgi:hypothetical protein